MRLPEPGSALKARELVSDDASDKKKPLILDQQLEEDNVRTAAQENASDGECGLRVHDAARFLSQRMLDDLGLEISSQALNQLISLFSANLVETANSKPPRASLQAARCYHFYHSYPAMIEQKFEENFKDKHKLVKALASTECDGTWNSTAGQTSVTSNG